MAPLLGPLNTRCRIILRTQKETIILTTTHTMLQVLSSTWRLWEDSTGRAAVDKASMPGEGAQPAFPERDVLYRPA